MTTGRSVLNLGAIDVADFSREPYPHFLGEGFLKDEAIQDLRRDFPAITKPGYLTVGDVDLKGRFRDLIDELEGPELTEVLSRRFGLDLPRPSRSPECSEHEPALRGPR
jgi:SM-20-related protein